MRVFDNVETCNNIRNLKNAKGISDKKLSKILGISTQAINKWWNYRCVPSIDNIVIMADLFDVNIDEILVRKEIS